MTKQRVSFGSVLFYSIASAFGVYLMFAAVQGDSGLFNRIQKEADAAALRAERDRLAVELATLENLTHRLSDSYLDLDLLDQQLRDVLGYVRPDEIVVE